MAAIARSLLNEASGAVALVYDGARPVLCGQVSFSSRAFGGAQEPHYPAAIVCLGGRRRRGSGGMKGGLLRRRRHPPFPVATDSQASSLDNLF